MKPAPLRPSHLPDSSHIFTSSNGIRMRNISHSVRKPKQAKKWVTVQSVQCHVAGWLYRPYGRTSDVAASSDDTWQVMEHMTGTVGPVRG
jgi:hypothetical protein